MAVSTVTIAAIAEQAGVSPTTVSNVLNLNRIGRRSDAKRNADRIRAIAGELGYRPNTAAQAMQKRRFNGIGLLASTDPRYSVYRQYLPGLTTGCREHDLSLSLGEVVDEKLEDEQQFPKILREWSVDGLIVAYMYADPPKLAEHIKRYSVPSIWLNMKRDHDAAYPDDREAFFRGASRLIAQGHRRIAYINTYAAGHYSHDDRRDGVVDAARAAGLTAELFYNDPPEPISTPQLFEDLTGRLQAPDRPTAILTYLSNHAMTVYHAALRCGLSVPEDLSIIGASHETIDGLDRPIATLLLPSVEVGRQAVDLLTRKIHRPGRELPAVAVPFGEGRFASTTAPPPPT